VDLGILFTALLAVTGGIWLLDVVVLKPRRAALADGRKAEPVVVEYARSFFPVILIVLLVRSFLFEPYRIPSESMMPGLIAGDFIFVNKYSYGLRLPITNTKIFSMGEPKRGDVVVFRLPSDPSTNLIKRLIGLPGDRITVRDNIVTVNGVELKQRAAGQYMGNDEFAGSPLVLEALGGKDHELLLAKDRPAADFDGIVPAEHYFFMGDNRNDSEDGRFAPVGFVPEPNLVGHAVLVAFNWHIPGWPQWRRIGKKIE
jgi:signal peptidase I